MSLRLELLLGKILNSSRNLSCFSYSKVFFTLSGWLWWMKCGWSVYNYLPKERYNLEPRIQAFCDWKFHPEITEDHFKKKTSHFSYRIEIPEIALQTKMQLMKRVMLYVLLKLYTIYGMQADFISKLNSINKSSIIWKLRHIIFCKIYFKREFNEVSSVYKEW